MKPKRRKKKKVMGELGIEPKSSARLNLPSRVPVRSDGCRPPTPYTPPPMLFFKVWMVYAHR